MATTEIQDQKVCDNLNNAARILVKEMGISNPVSALYRAAYDCGFSIEDDTGESCMIWSNGTTRINLWVDAPSGEIEDGGLGFDTQTEWAD